MIESLGIIFFLLLISAFFSGSETALTAASPPLMHRLEQDGDRRAAIVNRLHANKDRLIGAILLGNNLVNIMASAVATGFLIELFGSAGIAYATLGMTLLVLIFAEILPKTYAFRNANGAALGIAPWIGALVFLLAPITGALQWVVRGTFLIFGVRLDTNDSLGANADELRGAIELHEGDADDDEETTRRERAMLRSVLELQDVEVGEIMIHRKNVIALDADAPPAEIVDAVLSSPFTRLPLWRDDPDNIIGVLHAKALLRAVRARDGGLESLDGLDVVALAADPWFIPETTTLHGQLQAFRKRREHFSLVVDEYGALLGIVTLEDILEEIVGDIDDEHDITFSGVALEADGSYRVDGEVTIRDLNRQFEWRLPDEEAATLAGLVLHESRRIPDVGQSFKFHGFRFDILERQHNQITLVRVVPPQPEGDVLDQEPEVKE
ncbi:HlyC/CorC family transporter [Magnetospira sp. QH-2]|uniref:HlyC/CorC family transporter n=1 Tax=Magnetospira sp. (strain QH-2) TaxID=1288970 RepID=UPI0003E80BDF|nr:HlyC/CorC family transporter [Magnetospira sp. QH-2]CCQ74638.1 Putative HlyC/CorC family of transporters with 2 CBS domains [Magnetospira sp. QH-2]